MILLVDSLGSTVVFSFTASLGGAVDGCAMQEMITTCNPGKVIVFGGDGFCGWPTALHLSELGHQVIIVDNLSRRAIDIELGVESLTPIRSIGERINTWSALTGKEIKFHNIDISTEFAELLELLMTEKPDTVVHFAEQRAAPYSMKSAKHKSYTVRNNLCGTNNLLSAIVESGLDIHVAHLGTMGVYGYGTAGMALPEGYLNVYLKTDEGEMVEQEILYPTNPGSIYHLTKSQDALMFQFYNKNDKLRITDLHQGIVWGTQTAQTSRDERLINRFDYDGDYGTVLNRFLMQATVGYPLTVHGSGGQTRAFININDTVKCIELAVNNPPALNDGVQIFNQMAESYRLIDLAKMIADRTGCQISHVPNPRNEADENDLIVKNDKFKGLGWEPSSLADGLLQEVEEITKRYSSRCDISKIPCESTWTAKHSPGRPSMKVDAAE